MRPDLTDEERAQVEASRKWYAEHGHEWGSEASPIDQEAAALLERNHQRIRRDQARRGELKVHKHVIGTDGYEAVLCSPSVFPPTRLWDADWKRVTCLRCLRRQPAKIAREPVFGRNRKRPEIDLDMERGEGIRSPSESRR